MANSLPMTVAQSGPILFAHCSHRFLSHGFHMVPEGRPRSSNTCWRPTPAGAGACRAWCFCARSACSPRSSGPRWSRHAYGGIPGAHGDVAVGLPPAVHPVHHLVCHRRQPIKRLPSPSNTTIDPTRSGGRVHSTTRAFRSALVQRGEPVGEHRAAPALDHVQETGGPPVPSGQVHDHGPRTWSPGACAATHARSAPITATPSKRRSSSIRRAMPLDRTASFAQSHEQPSVMATLLTPVAPGTTEATDHHTTASVSRRPSAATRDRSSSHARPHPRHSQRRRRASK